MVSMNTLVKKKLQKKWHVDISRNSRLFYYKKPNFFHILPLRPFFGHFYIIKSDKSKNVPRYGPYHMVFINTLKKIMKKKYRKNDTYEFSRKITKIMIQLL